MDTRKPIRQGDILLVPVPALDLSKLDKVSRWDTPLVLAEGEGEGHLHRFRTSARVAGYRAKTDADFVAMGGNLELRADKDFIEVGAGGGKLRHEYADGKPADHAVTPIPPGAYRVVRQRENVGSRAAVSAFD